MEDHRGRGFSLSSFRSKKGVLFTKMLKDKGGKVTRGWMNQGEIEGKAKKPFRDMKKKSAQVS